MMALRTGRTGILSIQSGIGTLIYLIPVVIVFLALIPGTADAQDVLRRDPARHSLSKFINTHVEYGCRNTYVPERTGSANFEGQIIEIAVQGPNKLVAKKTGAEDITIEVEHCDAVVIGTDTGLCSNPDNSGTLPKGKVDFRIEYNEMSPGDNEDNICAMIEQQ